ncbi:hypothetical protein AOLI_G00139560 [Acnodon oligacanthus]
MASFPLQKPHFPRAVRNGSPERVVWALACVKCADRSPEAQLLCFEQIPLFIFKQTPSVRHEKAAQWHLCGGLPPLQAKSCSTALNPAAISLCYWMLCAGASFSANCSRKQNTKWAVKGVRCALGLLCLWRSCHCLPMAPLTTARASRFLPIIYRSLRAHFSQAPDKRRPLAPGLLAKPTPSPCCPSALRARHKQPLCDYPPRLIVPIQTRPPASGRRTRSSALC